MVIQLSASYTRFLEQLRLHPESSSQLSTLLLPQPRDSCRRATADFKVVSFSLISATMVSEKCGSAQLSFAQWPLKKSEHLLGLDSSRRTATGNALRSTLSSSLPTDDALFSLYLPFLDPLHFPLPCGLFQSIPTGDHGCGVIALLLIHSPTPSSKCQMRRAEMYVRPCRACLFLRT